MARIFDVIEYENEMANELVHRFPDDGTTGDYRLGSNVIVRTGQMERCLEEKEWGGYAGGDAPGVKFENCYWCQDKQIAAICTDTWGVEVRPNETKEANQPWHWVVIPAMGLCMGEIFYLKELAEDCEEDGVDAAPVVCVPLVVAGD